jgi:ribulose-5-phosphate 4-epimerase/fuculose-1-phosphate aldolase
MSENSPPLEAVPWADLSLRVGQDLLLTQASGGNTSIKLDDQRFLVKASGLRLGEVTPQRGWVLADYRQIRKGIPGLDRHTGVEAKSIAYQTLLSSSTITRGSKISLEAGLHALLPHRWVAHVHSIAGQLLGLMPQEEARQWASRVWGEEIRLCWIPPAVPGHDLCARVARSIALGSPGQTENLWILQNHGIAWGGETDEEIFWAVDAFEGPLRNRFGLHRYPAPQVEPLDSHDYPTPQGKTWYRVELAGWPQCRFDTTPVLTDFVGHFDLWSDAPPDFIQADDTTAHILAASPREIDGHAQVFFAHALVSTIARQEGWFRALPAEAIHAIKLLSLERPTYSSGIFS